MKHIKELYEMSMEERIMFEHDMEYFLDLWEEIIAKKGGTQ